MRTPTDALRSMVRYTSLALGPEWEVRISTERGTFQRPYARVTQVPAIQLLTPRWDTSKLLTTIAVVAYPLPGAEADASQLEALRIVDLLWVAFAGQGAGTPNIRTPLSSYRGRPYRIPLYDYAGIPLDGAGALVSEEARDPRDFLHVESPPEVQTFNDPDDELLYSVAANIRMSWLRSAAVTSAAPTATGVQIRGQTDG